MAFAPPELQGRKLVCVIDRVVAEIGAADVAVYCFAVSIVDRETVRDVDVWVRTKVNPNSVMAIFSSLFIVGQLRRSSQVSLFGN